MNTMDLAHNWYDKEKAQMKRDKEMALFLVDRLKNKLKPYSYSAIDGYFLTKKDLEKITDEIKHNVHKGICS